MIPAVIVVVVVVSSLSARVVTAGLTSLRPYDINDAELELELEPVRAAAWRSSKS